MVEVLPFFAAVAMVTMSVTFGVSLAKKGILEAARTHRQISYTIVASWRTNTMLCTNSHIKEVISL